MKKLIFIVLILLLMYTRFVNLSWGFPYPMHPDERNMAVAIQSLNCYFRLSTLDFRNCFNPHFFAYGQFPLYLSYGGVQLMKFFDGDVGTLVSFQEAVFSLRIISATASVFTVLVMIGIMNSIILQDKKKKFSILHSPFLILIFIFSPSLIQFAHFGTTESLLILFYSLIIYFSLLFVQKKLINTEYVLLTSLFCGFALATKISSGIYVVIPLLVFFYRFKKKCISSVALFFFFTTIFFMLFSPHSILSSKEFFSSMQYESAVALGQAKVFYTRQFDHTVPIIFQITKIFPYALGLPVFILGMLGLLRISWKKKEYNLLRLAFILVFLPNAFMYAKWTRFIAPTFPLMIIFAILFLSKIRISRLIFYIIVFIMIIPGIAYLSVYQNTDVRFQASEWISKNILSGSLILSETANVVDLPLSTTPYNLPPTTFNIISFNFYDLDTDKKLQKDIGSLILSADYIIIPSRRIFKNHSQEKYPLLNEYYRRLFSGQLGFKKVAEFNSYPDFKFQILNFKFQMEFPDEDAEETWSVFDHPVIRIYKRITKTTFSQ